MQGKPAQPELKRLNMREEAFVHVYAETGNRIKAWAEAGWKGCENGKLKTWAAGALSRILRRPHVAAALTALKNERKLARIDAEQFTLEWLRAELMDLYKRSREVKELPTAARCLELTGKTMGVFSDTLNLNTDRLRTYTEAEQAEAKRMAGLLLEHNLTQTSAGPGPEDESNADALPGADPQPGQAQDQAGADPAQTGDAPQPAQDQDTATPQAGPGEVMQDTLPHLSGSVTVLDRSETMHGYAQQQDKAVLVGLASV